MALFIPEQLLGKNISLPPPQKYSVYHLMDIFGGNEMLRIRESMKEAQE
jgi:hypothetical protein